MPSSPSPRILAAIDALPLQDGMRVLEIGCGSGVAAREIARRHPRAYVLGIDRSASAIRTACAAAKDLTRQGRLAFLRASAESFKLDEGEALFDLAFALRVGAFDGRHPEVGAEALPKVAAALKRRGRFFIDGGSPLRELQLR